MPIDDTYSGIRRLSFFVNVELGKLQYATFIGEQNSAFLKVFKLNSIDDAFF